MIHVLIYKSGNDLVTSWELVSIMWTYFTEYFLLTAFCIDSWDFMCNVLIVYDSVMLLSHADEMERLRSLEEEQEHLNNSLFALTTHFAQVQFRLKQIVSAPADIKEVRDTCATLLNSPYSQISHIEMLSRQPLYCSVCF